MTTDTLSSVWDYTLELSRALAEYDTRILLATMGAPLTEEQNEQVEQLENVEVFPSWFRVEWMDNPWDDVAAAGRWLIELEERFHPDLIHLNSYAHGALDFHTPKLVAAHFSPVSCWPAARDQAPVSRVYQRNVRDGLRGANVVVSPTRARIAGLEAEHGRLRNAEVIRNGRDPQWFTATRKEPIVFSFGRLWDESVNIAALDTVAPKLPWPVLVAEDCAGPDGKAAGLNNVHLLGRLSEQEMASQLSRVSIYVSPAYCHGTGLSVLDAALSGCALVLGDTPDARELWDDAAIFIPPDDHSMLERGILELISHPVRVSAFAAVARERALDMTSRQMVESYLAVYAEMMSARVLLGAETSPRAARLAAAFTHQE